MFPQQISWRSHPMVYGLAAINLMVYLAVQFIQPRTPCFGGLSTYLVLVEGEYWRILSSMFMHYDLSHILFNLVALFIFGAYAERFWGWRRGILIYLFCGIFANCVALVYWRDLITYCAIGASGSILGIMAATGYLMWVLWRQQRNPIAYQFARQLAIILAIQFILDTFIAETSFLHHIMGAAAGFFLAWLMLRRRSFLM